MPPDFLTGVGSDVVALRTAFLDALSNIPGAKVVNVAYPADWNLMTGTFNNIRLSERTEPFLPYMKQDPKLFGVSLLSWLQGLFLSGDEWVTGQRAKHHLIREVLDVVMAGWRRAAADRPGPVRHPRPARTRRPDRVHRHRRRPEGPLGDDHRRPAV